LQGQNLLLKVDPLLLFAQGEQLETSAKFCIENIIATFKTAIYDIQVFVSHILPPLEHSAACSFCFVGALGGLHVFKEI